MLLCIGNKIPFKSRVFATLYIIGTLTSKASVTFDCRHRTITLATMYRTILGASQMATVYEVCVHIIYEHRAISCTGPWVQAGAEAVRISYSYRTEIVRYQCSYPAVSSASSQISCDIVQRSYDDPMRLQPPYDFLAPPQIVLFTFGLR